MNIAPGLDIDADYLAGRSIAVLGKRGVGKSTTCRVLAEELADEKIQTVILDPMGVFWGLRADTAGHGNGVPIPVFGGSHGDVPLEPSAGTLMADIAVERQLSMVLDLSGFDNHEQEFAFAAEFFTHLLRENSGLVHVIVDEADHFAPQTLKYKEQKAALNSMINLVRRGRNKAIGVTMASQRAASLSKDVLSQVDVLAAMRMTAPADRDAIAAWVRGQGDPEAWSQIAETLPKLAVGEGWWWVPEHEILNRATVRRARTFDTSPTRSRRNSASREPAALTTVDLARIADQIAATRERAAANDPVALTARIRDLEAQIQKLHAGGADGRGVPRTVEVPVEVRVEVPVPYVPESVANDVAALREHAAATAREAQQLADAIDELQGAVDDVPAKPEPVSAPMPAPAVPVSVVEAPPAPSRAAPGTAAPQSNGDRLPSGAHRMIESLGRMAPLRLTKSQWSMVSGLQHTGGTWSNYMSLIRRAGLISESPAGATLTDEGFQYLGVRPEPMTAAELQQHYMEILPAGARRMLQASIDAYPRALTKEQLSEESGVTVTGGTFSNYRSMLRRNGLVENRPGGSIVATEILIHGAAQPNRSEAR